MRAASSDVETAVLQAVAYGDIFDYPLTAEQIHRYLVGVRSSPSAIRDLLDMLGNGSALSGQLECSRGYYFLPGREEIVDTRLRRAEISARAWPMARRYGAVISGLPFIRMVAVSGALTMDNMEADTDIDFFIVTEPGRLWSSRAMVVAVVQVAARNGHTICPNYFLSRQCLALPKRNLFTAHELAQMVPIYGLDVYYRMCHLNSWAYRFLPNAFAAEVDTARHDALPEPAPAGRSRGWWRFPRAAAEAALRTSAGGWIESWEMRRKVRKFTGQLATAGGGSVDAPLTAAAEVDFGPDRCKGHFDRHGQTTLAAFRERLKRVSTAAPSVVESLEVLEESTNEEMKMPS
jgi:hypothetical protein